MKTRLLILSALLTATTTWADVEINETNFPDANFRNYLLSQSYGSDGVLTDAEIAGVNYFSIQQKSIRSLKGVEYFTALTSLDCAHNSLTALDVSKNIKLTYLTCWDNRLTTLDVSQNTALVTLICEGNQLTRLDVSKNTALTRLYCCDNRLTSLDVSKNTELTLLSCYKNRIKGAAMDALVESLPASVGEMQVIYYENEQNVMTTTQVAAAWAKGWTPLISTQPADQWSMPNWSEYVGSADPNFENVIINEENFPDENFRNYLLSQPYGADGMLTDVEITEVRKISVGNNNVQSLKGIEFFTSLRELTCSENPITALDVSKNTRLTSLICWGNQLTELNISGCSLLKELFCIENLLTTLDVSGCPALTSLNCLDNQLTTLTLPKSNKLKELRCQNNRLTELDVSGCTALQKLYCHENQLMSLNVNGCKALKLIYCFQNQIKGTAMNAFVGSLPSASNGMLVVNDKENEQSEQNMMSTDQVAEAKSRGWKSYSYIGLVDKEERIEEYAGNDTSGSGIAINEENFPDENFRSWLLAQTYGEDGMLTDTEILGITSIKVPGCSIQRLNGIEFFAVLETLDCSNNQLTELDVSKNFSLASLDCSNNQLTSLDVSQNLELGTLRCYSNQINGSAMDALVESLPYSYGMMYVIYNKNEGNVMTTTQVAAAKSKRWTPYQCTGYNEQGKEIWEKYAGSEPDGIKDIDQSPLSIDHYYYDLNGRKLNGKPTTPGLYIIGGKKVVVK